MLATLVAWPGMQGGSAPDGYQVNCWAYHGREPTRGDWVWLADLALGRAPGRPGRGGSRRRAGVVGGRTPTRRRAAPLSSRPPPVNLAYSVLKGHVLVDPEVGSSTRGSSSGRPVLVPRDQILGRAWARFDPVWERRLLP